MRRTVMAMGMVCLLAAGVAGAQETEKRGGCGRRGGGLEVVGLTFDQRLVCFGEHTPFFSREIGEVTGLEKDTRIVGIDFRPATGVLYALGDAGGIYTLDLDDAFATLSARVNVPLRGSFFGIDFNPTVDRLRVVSDAGQNVRVNVADGVTAPDTDLSNPPTAGTALGVTGAGYTNNDADPNTNTTLYDIDSVLDQVSIQSPPNQGELVATGKLGVDAELPVGFDIYSRLRQGTTVEVTALASLVSAGRARFYEIDLVTGRAKLRGNFRLRDQVVDIAIPVNQR
jgi:hypothetical protein